MITEHDQHWVFVCDHVYNAERPLRRIIHDRDGDWQLLCGEFDHDVANAKLVCSACALEQFPEFAKRQTLPSGFLTECVDGEWQMANHDFE